jgi:hypothetical protein
VSLDELRSLPCGSCGGRSDLLVWLDHAVRAWPVEHCVAACCPRCGGDVHLQLACGRAALGELTPPPGRVFRPSVRVDQPGLESLLRPEGWIVRLLHRRWIFQAGAGP